MTVPVGRGNRTIAYFPFPRRSGKATFPAGKGPNDMGSSRYHLVRACEASLKRLGTDHTISASCTASTR
jgi:hypothetical protein